MFLPYSEDKTEQLRRIVGADNYTLAERDEELSAVLKNADDPKTINNAKLAQQLCGIIITK